MSIRIFYESALVANSLYELSEKHSHYLVNVMRCKIGDSVNLFNHIDGEFLCQIVDIKKRNVTVQALKIIRHKEEGDFQKITICIPFLKPDTLSTIVRQASEMGVDRICFFRAERSSVAKINSDRYRQISIEAIEQSRGLKVPDFIILKNIDDVLSYAAKSSIFFADEALCGGHTASLDKQDKRDIFAIFGPEGGFSERERELIKDNHGTALSLGKKILKCDTAAICLLFMIRQVFK